MRKPLAIGVAMVAMVLALPMLASAASTDCHEFTLQHGVRHKVFLVHMPTNGTLKLVFHYSDVRNPHAHFYVNLLKAGWKEDVLLIDTADRSACQGALGTFYCHVNAHRAPPRAGTT